MKLTPDQRRARIHELMGKNSDFMRMKDAFESAERWFRKFTALLPRPLRSRLLEYPGMMQLMHRRMIDAACRHMKFSDED